MVATLDVKVAAIKELEVFIVETVNNMSLENVNLLRVEVRVELRFKENLR